MGLENLNGGTTVISGMYPGVAGISSRVMPWGGELQIQASNQNEFMYSNGFNGPFYGGFAQVIDTFEHTEKPRRLKPVNVYYHFYSARGLASLRSIEKIQRWCLEQKLHSMTALDFVKMTRDSYSTKIYDCGPRHWVIVNGGFQRTFRLPAYLGRPDMTQCSGVTGWKVEGDALFVHTSGSKLTELSLADANAKLPPHLRLTESSAEIQFSERSALKVVFETEDLRPVETIFSGLLPNFLCDVIINGKPSRVSADASGSISLTLPFKASVSLDATHAHHAKLR